MKAIRLTEPGHIVMTEVPEPELGPEDVLVEVRYVGLCGTDLSSYRGASTLVSYPRVPGHEVSGRIIARGARVPERVEVGAPVTLSPYTSCGLCPPCREGRTNTCQFNQTLGVQRDGALTERLAVPYYKVFTSRVLSPQELALVEPLSVGYHATNRGRVSEADTVLVLGCGTIGMGAVVAAARKGATVIAADVDEAKLETARRFGAQHTIQTVLEDAPARARALTGGEGTNVCIEAVGLPETYRQAVDAVCYGGRVVCIGYAKKNVEFDTAEFVRKELDILGSRNALGEFPAVIRMLERRERPFAELITAVYPFARAAEAFADWDAAPGKFAKILIDVQG